jgi:glyoxylase-like metal-dependent hydrolase (beta-lactamase superfamily II)
VAEGLKVVDEFDGGLGWTEDAFLGRTSHALAADGGVWLVDPVDPEASDTVSQAIAALGDVAGVIQLLDRHSRDSAKLAERFGVEHVVAYAGQNDTPFELVPLVRRRQWREVALWWPERRVLVCADALGTIGYFVAPGDRIGVHPLLRLFPPRALVRLDPERILVGHGEGIHHDATAALREALTTARRRAPGVLVGAVNARRRRRRDM